MRKFVAAAGLAALLCLAVSPDFAKTPPTAKTAAGTIVIVFKDGHRQSFNLSEVARIEFPGAAESAAPAAAANSTAPSRGHFLGEWEVGDGSGATFTITLYDNGDAYRSLGHVHGKWVYVDGEARVTWNDGAQDAIRKVGSIDQKFAYRKGKSFTDKPDNVAGARNTSKGAI
jgi:hypothetical protein